MNLNNKTIADAKDERIYKLESMLRAYNVPIPANKKQLPSEYKFYPVREKIEKLLIKHQDKYKLRIVRSACIYDAVIAKSDLDI